MNKLFLQERLIFLSEPPFTAPCLIKKTFGVECPGCGFQRSLWALMEGRLMDSLEMYPALIPVLCTAVFLFCHLLFKFNRGAYILIGLFSFSVLLMFGNFFVKQWTLFHS